MKDMKLASYNTLEREEHEEVAPETEHRQIVPGHYKKKSSCD